MVEWRHVILTTGGDLMKVIKRIFQKKNVPNILTTLRLLCVTPIILLMWDGPHYILLSILWIGGVMTTDILDGYLARKLEVATKFGRRYDASADKIVTFTILPALTFWRGLPKWLAITLATMYLSIFIFAFVRWLKDKPMPPPRKLGKYAIFAWSIVAYFFIIEVSLIASAGYVIALFLSGMAYRDYWNYYVVNGNSE